MKKLNHLQSSYEAQKAAFEAAKEVKKANIEKDISKYNSLISHYTSLLRNSETALSNLTSKEYPSWETFRTEAEERSKKDKEKKAT